MALFSAVKSRHVFFFSFKIFFSLFIPPTSVLRYNRNLGLAADDGCNQQQLESIPALFYLMIFY